MSKQTNLQLVNGVLKNIGEPTISALTSLTTIQQMALDAINDVLYEVAFDADWRPLEATGTFTMTTGTATYTETSTMLRENTRALFQTDSGNILDYLTPTEWAQTYPKGIGTATTGYPTALKREGGYWWLNKYPTATQNGKVITFPHWQLPTVLTTTTTTQTSWFPEGMDLLVLINLATYKLLHYKNNPESSVYWNKVYGQGGYYEKMKKVYSVDAGRLHVRVTDSN